MLFGAGSTIVIHLRVCSSTSRIVNFQVGGVALALPPNQGNSVGKI
jgi:hypothetical protein